jgi:hypothetical protein
MNERDTRFKTVFARESGLMRTKKTSAKQPPNFLILLRKTSGDGCVDRVEHIFCGQPGIFFF